MICLYSIGISGTVWMHAHAHKKVCTSSITLIYLAVFVLSSCRTYSRSQETWWCKKSYPLSQCPFLPMQKFHAVQISITICNIHSGCIQNGITYNYQAMELHQLCESCAFKLSCHSKEQLHDPTSKLLEHGGPGPHPWFAVEGENHFARKDFLDSVAMLGHSHIHGFPYRT